MRTGRGEPLTSAGRDMRGLRPVRRNALELRNVHSMRLHDGPGRGRRQMLDEGAGCLRLPGFGAGRRRENQCLLKFCGHSADIVDAGRPQPVADEQRDFGIALE